jgi:hypothetical protein
MTNNPDLFDGTPLGRLAYWRSKAELCGRLATRAADDGDINAALKNTMRMAYALEQVIQIETEIGK